MRTKRSMIELVQIPWSPFCLVQRRILEFSGHPHRLVSVPSSDRSLIWRLTRQRYYQVPILKDGRTVIFETDEHSQVLSKYLEAKWALGLFPPAHDGVQKLLWKHVENEIEGLTFKLNDAHYREFVPAAQRLNFLRFKERKFGRGCLEQWLQHQEQLLADLTVSLVPFEQMLAHRSFLLDGRPRFLDFDLWGMLANFLYSGHYHLSADHPKLSAWWERMSKIKYADLPREKLHS